MGDSEKISVVKSLKTCCGFHWRGKLTLIIPLITLPFLIYGLIENKPEYKCIYLIVNMAVFWITECIPLYITSLFPIVFLPLFGILSSEVTCGFYFTDTLVMFLGGLILALAIEYSNLHIRIALGLILLMGCSPRRLHVGLLVVTAFLSLWLSNSATAAMMSPIVKAVLMEMEAKNLFSTFKTQEEEPVEEGQKPHPSTISMAYYFGVAYAASIGGCASLIGTGTNLSFKGIYETRFPDSKETVDFSNFMAYAMPLCVVLNLVLLCVSLQITHMGLFRKKSKIGQDVSKGTDNRKVAQEVIMQRFRELGDWTCHEIQVALVIIIMVFLLFSARPGFMKGWMEIMSFKQIGSSTIVFCAVALLTALPTQYTFLKYCCGASPFPGRTMDACISWAFVHKNMPWGLVFLIGGGFALAEGSRVSGVTKMMANSFVFLKSFPKELVVGIVIVISMICTAFSSNIIVCNILVPIFCEMAIAIQMHPLFLTLPATLAMSFAFHLPVSTPPNAIVCEYAGIKTKYLALAGIAPTVIGIIILWVNAIAFGPIIYPAILEFPKWAADS